MCLPNYTRTVKRLLGKGPVLPGAAPRGGTRNEGMPETLQITAVRSAQRIAMCVLLLACLFT